MVDGTTVEGEESPVTTNKHSFIVTKDTTGSDRTPHGTRSSGDVAGVTGTALRNDSREEHCNHAAGSTIWKRRAPSRARLTLVAIGLILPVSGVLETSGVRHITGPIGKRLVRDRRTVARNTNSHRSLPLSITCNRPPGASGDAWCVAAGFEITSPCAADFVQSGFTDFANFGVCTYNVIAQAGWLPGCSSDLEVTLYATCLETL